VAGFALGEERLGVFEFFGRTGGAYCQGAAPAVNTLQNEMAGRAVLLEYPYDNFTSGRVDRWWAGYTGSPSVFLPLVMVGSGLQVDHGPVDYYNRYKAMLNAELARAPAAAMRVWSRRVGDGLQVYVRATNLSGVPLTLQNAASFWVIVWEDKQIGLTRTWVRATATRPLPASLQPGETTTATIDVPSLGAVDWQRLRALALLEHRPGGTGRYDMLQAAIAEPAEIEVAPAQITLSASQPSATVALDGPGILSWSASPQVAWLQASPAGGGFPGTCVVSLVGTPPAGQTGSVRFTAAGSGMTTSTTLTVTTQHRTSRIRRHLSRHGGT
jgi:hypothetical protein